MSAPPLQSASSSGVAPKLVVVPIASSPGGRAGTALFFGSLCVGTFALGVWQCQRYLEKQVLEEQRTTELQQDPVNIYEYCRLGDTAVEPNSTKPAIWKKPNFRKLQLQGYYDHSHELWVGPRGPPPGALPDKPGQSAQGMSSSPQGYYILTPLFLTPEPPSISSLAAVNPNEAPSDTTTTTKNNSSSWLRWISFGSSSSSSSTIIQKNDSTATNNTNSAVILVNRGWIPRNVVLGHTRNINNYDSTQQQALDRPTGLVSITAVPSKPEEPTYLKAEHNFQSRPPRLYWYDLPSMLACAGMPFYDANNNNNNNNNNDHNTAITTPNDTITTKTIENGPYLLPIVYVTEVADTGTKRQQESWPVCPTADKVGEFKVSTSVHAAYAFTWFGLSTAGLYMTRILLTKR